MAISKMKENLNLYNATVTLSDTLKVECSCEFQTSLSEILSVNSTAILLSDEIKNGVYKCVGKIIYTVCYKDAENNLQKRECACEFTGKILNDELHDGNLAKTRLEILRTEVCENGNKYSLTSTVFVSSEIYAQETKTYILGGENMLVKKEPAEFTYSLGVKNCTLPIMEEFEINYPVSEVLFHKEELIVTGVQCGLGNLIIDGELLFSIFLLQNGKSNDIVKETKIIPVRLETEYDSADPTSLAKATCYIKDAHLAVTSYEDSFKSVIKADLRARIVCEAFKTNETEIVVDAFSKTDDFTLEKTEIKMRAPAGRYSTDAKFCERVFTPETVEVGAKILAVNADCVKIVTQNLLDGVLTLELVVRATAFIKNTDGAIYSSKYEFPVTIKEQVNINDDNIFMDLTATVSEIYLRLITLNEADAYGTIKISAEFDTKKSVLVAFDTTVIGEKKPNDSAYSVFLALKGEDLWDLSKRLNLSPSEVETQNPDLTFPLNGDEQIIIFRRRTK